MKEIYIVGIGSYSEVMYELATDCGYTVKGFYDAYDGDYVSEVMGKPVLGHFDECVCEDIKCKDFIVAVGDNIIRHRIMSKIDKCEGNLPTLIHPTAKISTSVHLGKGVYIHMGAVVWTKAQINDFSIISPNTVIAHHAKIGKACLISVSSVVGARVCVDDYTMFGIGSIAITGIDRIGKNVMLGAGTTVTKNIEDNVLAVGSPARVIKQREPIE